MARPISIFRGALTDQGLPEWLVDALVELYEAVQGNRAGHLARVTSEVEAVTRRSPRTLEQFAQEMFGHLPSLQMNERTLKRDRSEPQFRE